MTVDCSDSAEIFWMLLTFMTLLPEDQVRHLPYVPTKSQVALLDSPRTNPLLALTLALQSHGWRDDFYPGVAKLDAFEAAIDRFAIVDNLGLYCREEFLDGRAWRELRELARAALSESNMGPHPVPEHIDFHELIEFSDE
jgi:hypothetical protein